jgi:type IV pilus assembly protein PilO
MNEFLTRFMDRPRGHKIAAWVGSLLLVGLVFWQSFYADIAQQVAVLQERRADLNSQIEVEQRLVRNLAAYRTEVGELEVQLRQALQELPDKKEIPELLKSISTLATQAGLEEALFRPVPEVFREFYAEVPVAIAVQGTFHQVAKFFDEVGRLPRIVNINQIAVREPELKDDEVRIKAECTATTFRYLDEAEMARHREATEDAKKRRRRS